MLVLLHVSIAISTLIYTGYVFFRPSKPKIYISYTLVGTTIASGTALVIVKNANLISACITGLLYLAVTLPFILTAHRRLAKETAADL